jgi:hypothetical protein
MKQENNISKQMYEELIKEVELYFCVDRTVGVPWTNSVHHLLNTIKN